jgi:hypothetical protein
MALGAIALAVSWLLILTALVLDFAGILRRGTARRWQGTGLLVMNSAALIGDLARLRGWSVGPLDTLHTITLPITLAGFALLVIGISVQVKARRNGPVNQASN